MKQGLSGRRAAPTCWRVSTKVTTEQKRLRRTGNSSGVTLSKKILAVAGIGPDDEVIVSASEGRVTIALAGGIAECTRTAGQAVLEQYRFAFEALAKERSTP